MDIPHEVKHCILLIACRDHRCRCTMLQSARFLLAFPCSFQSCTKHIMPPFFAVSSITKIVQIKQCKHLPLVFARRNVLVGCDIGARHFSYACMIRSGSCWQHKMCKILPRSTRNSLCAHLMLAVQDLTVSESIHCYSA